MSCFFQIVDARQIRRGKQKRKRIIQGEIRGFSAFFDACELHSKVIKKDKRIGLATIYRFLKSEEKTGTLHSFLCKNKKIYSIHTTNHAHFTCEKCQTTKHLKIKNIDFIKGILDDDICHFQIELTGLCSTCKNK